MPSTAKTRQTKNQSRKAAEADFDKRLGPIPDHIERLLRDLEPNTDAVLAKSPLERAPPHIVDYDEHPSLKHEVLRDMSANAAADRSRKREEKIASMMAICGDIWGRRGKARVVAIRWFKLTGERVPLRTIQQYFRDTRI